MSKSTKKPSAKTLIAFSQIAVRASGKTVEQTRTPVVSQVAKPGVVELVLYPGFNVVETAVLEQHMADETFVKQFKRGIKVLEAPPVTDVALVEKSYSRDALLYLRDRVEDAEDAFDDDTDRQYMLEAIEKQLGKASYSIRPQPYTLPNMPSNLAPAATV